MAKNQFQDPDLHTPAHDAFMMWLDENADAVAEPHCRFLQRDCAQVKAPQPEYGPQGGLF